MYSGVLVSTVTATSAVALTMYFFFPLIFPFFLAMPSKSDFKAVLSHFKFTHEIILKSF